MSPPPPASGEAEPAAPKDPSGPVLKDTDPITASASTAGSTAGSAQETAAGAAVPGDGAVDVDAPGPSDGSPNNDATGNSGHVPPSALRATRRFSGTGSTSDELAGSGGTKGEGLSDMASAVAIAGNRMNRVSGLSEYSGESQSSRRASSGAGSDAGVSSTGRRGSGLRSSLLSKIQGRRSSNDGSMTLSDVDDTRSRRSSTSRVSRRSSALLSWGR